MAVIVLVLVLLIVLVIVIVVLTVIVTVKVMATPAHTQHVVEKAKEDVLQRGVSERVDPPSQRRCKTPDRRSADFRSFGANVYEYEFWVLWDPCPLILGSRGFVVQFF